MLALGFALLWVVLALGVLLLAFRGRGGALVTKARARSTAFGLMVASVFAITVAVPGLVLAFNGAHKASVGPGGVSLTGEQQYGRELFARTCAVCHTLQGAAAVGRVGPNLDVLLTTIGSTEPPGAAQQSRAAFVLDAIQSGRGARGRGEMPAGLYVGQDANAVASFVAAVAGR